jgi:hypothetical protein
MTHKYIALLLFKDMFESPFHKYVIFNSLKIILGIF